MHIDAPLRFQHVLCTPLAFGLLGPLPLASAQGPTPLEMAIEALELSHPLPSGWSVQFGKVSQGAGADVDPEDKRITIDPERVATSYPRITEHEANLPGVLDILLLHEWHHANEHATDPKGDGPYNTDPRPCGDAQLTPVIAAAHCELIWAILLHGNGNIGPLCDLYCDIRDNYDHGQDGTG